jgi:hypothetical protein
MSDSSKQIEPVRKTVRRKTTDSVMCRAYRTNLV